MARNVTRAVTAGVVLLVVPACERPAPTTTDTTAPEITVTVSGGRGGNIFRSIDGVLDTPDHCIKAPGPPVQLVMIVADAGGVRRAGISALGGTVVPASVDVTPRAPEGTFTITSERGAGILDMTLTPPAPGTIRTGATAILEIDGRLPFAITADARDYAGNLGALPQFDVRALDDPVVCRGEPIEP